VKSSIEMPSFENPQQGIIFKIFTSVNEATITCWERVCEGKNVKGETYESDQGELGNVVQSICTDPGHCMIIEKDDHLEHVDRFLKGSSELSRDHIWAISLITVYGITSTYCAYSTCRKIQNIWNIYQKKKEGNRLKEVIEASFFATVSVMCALGTLSCINIIKRI
jgi:hypothetical protein